MTFIALKPLDGGSIEAGTVIPHAEDWGNSGVLIWTGSIAHVVDGMEQEFLNDMKIGIARQDLAPKSHKGHLCAAARLLSHMERDRMAALSRAVAVGLGGSENVSCFVVDTPPSRPPSAKLQVRPRGRPRKRL